MTARLADWSSIARGRILDVTSSQQLRSSTLTVPQISVLDSRRALGSRGCSITTAMVELIGDLPRRRGTSSNARWRFKCRFWYGVLGTAPIRGTQCTFSGIDDQQSRSSPQPTSRPSASPSSTMFGEQRISSSDAGRPYLNVQSPWPASTTCTGGQTPHRHAPQPVSEVGREGLRQALPTTHSLPIAEQPSGHRSPQCHWCTSTTTVSLVTWAGSSGPSMALTDGYSVLAVYMPRLRPGDCAVVLHDRLVDSGAVRAATGSPMKYFWNRCGSLNYLKTAPSPTISVVSRLQQGRSLRGGWTTTVYAAIDLDQGQHSHGCLVP